MTSMLEMKMLYMQYIVIALIFVNSQHAHKLHCYKYTVKSQNKGHMQIPVHPLHYAEHKLTFADSTVSVMHESLM